MASYERDEFVATSATPDWRVFALASCGASWDKRDRFMPGLRKAFSSRYGVTFISQVTLFHRAFKKTSH